MPVQSVAAVVAGDLSAQVSGKERVIVDSSMSQKQPEQTADDSLTRWVYYPTWNAKHFLHVQYSTNFRGEYYHVSSHLPNCCHGAAELMTITVQSLKLPLRAQLPSYIRISS